jgi:hypothetical protein
MSELQSPRGSLRLTPRPDGVAAVFTCEDVEWLRAASDAVDFVARLRHPSIPDVRGVVRHDERLELSFGLRPGSVPVGRSIDDVAAVADIADGIATITGASGGFPCGPLDPALLARAPDGRGQLVAPCLWALAYALDQGTRGAMMTMRHFIVSPDSLRGTRGPKTETFYLAHALFRALAGRNPFPFNDDYFSAVLEGRCLSLAALRPDLPPRLTDAVMLGLANAPDARPAPADFAAALRASLAGS